MVSVEVVYPRPPVGTGVVAVANRRDGKEEQTTTQQATIVDQQQKHQQLERIIMHTIRTNNLSRVIRSLASVLAIAAMTIAFMAPHADATLLDLSSATTAADSMSFANRGPEKAFNNYFNQETGAPAGEGEPWQSATGSAPPAETHWIYVDLGTGPLGRPWTINRIDIELGPTFNNPTSYTLRTYLGATPPDPDTSLSSWTTIGTMTSRSATGGNDEVFDEIWNFDAGSWTDLDSSGNPVAGGGTATGIAFQPYARWLLLEGVNTSDLGSYRVNVAEFDVYVSVIPEPSTMMLLGLGGWVMIRARKRFHRS
jgi:hypothetical protein